VPISDGRYTTPDGEVGSGRHFTSASPNGASWGPLIEKALAALDQTWSPERLTAWQREWNWWNPESVTSGLLRVAQGGYYSLTHNSVVDGAKNLTRITGKRTTVSRFPELGLTRGEAAAAVAETANRLRRLIDNGCPVIVGSRPDAAERVPGTGISGGHAYAIIAVTDHDTVRLDNPWGHKHVTELPIERLLKIVEAIYVHLEPAASSDNSNPPDEQAVPTVTARDVEEAARAFDPDPGAVVTTVERARGQDYARNLLEAESNDPRNGLDHLASISDRLRGGAGVPVRGGRSWTVGGVLPRFCNSGSLGRPRWPSSPMRKSGTCSTSRAPAVTWVRPLRWLTES
jgi:hypothetical protein